MTAPEHHQRGIELFEQGQFAEAVREFSDVIRLVKRICVPVWRFLGTKPAVAILVPRTGPSPDCQLTGADASSVPGQDQAPLESGDASHSGRSSATPRLGGQAANLPDSGNAEESGDRGLGERTHEVSGQPDARSGAELALREDASRRVNQGDFRGALEVLKEGLAAGMQSAGIFGDLGALHFLLGNAEGAEEAMRQALALNPRDVDALRNWAELLLVTHRYDEAMEVFMAILPAVSPDQRERIRGYLRRAPAPRVAPECVRSQRISATWKSMEGVADLERRELQIDATGFQRFCCTHPYTAAAHIYEKKLEYYASSQLLNLSAGDRFVDIASQSSPFPAFVQRTTGCEAYRQDLNYKPGLHGREIGCDASAIPVPDGFFTKMTLHCSFEHFEGDSDTGFVREAARTLAPGGKVCIIPLYVGLKFRERRIERYGGPGDERNMGEGCEFQRAYDAGALADRVIAPSRGLFSAEIHRITNLESLRSTLPAHAALYANFALLLTRTDRPV